MTSNWKSIWRQIKSTNTSNQSSSKLSTTTATEGTTSRSSIVNGRRFKFSRWRSKASRATSNLKKDNIMKKETTNYKNWKYILLNKQYSRVFSRASYIILYRPRCSQSTSLTTPLNRQRRRKEQNRILSDRLPTKHIFGDQTQFRRFCFVFALRFQPFLLA